LRGQARQQARRERATRGAMHRAAVESGAVDGHIGLLGRWSGTGSGTGRDGEQRWSGAGRSGGRAQRVISRTARPGKIAKTMTRGMTKKTTGMSMRISRWPAVSISSRLEDSRASWAWARSTRSEEHTSELQSRENLVCRLLLEKKKAHPL